MKKNKHTTERKIRHNNINTVIAELELIHNGELSQASEKLLTQEEKNILIPPSNDISNYRSTN